MNRDICRGNVTQPVLKCSWAFEAQMADRGKEARFLKIDVRDLMPGMNACIGSTCNYKASRFIQP